MKGNGSSDTQKNTVKIIAYREFFRYTYTTPQKRGAFFREKGRPMYTVALIIELIVAILLMVVVLMQSSKGGGLAGAFGGSNLGTVFGVRRTADFLTKATQVLAAIFMVLALVINLWLLPRGTATRESVIQSAPPATSLPPIQEAPAPASSEQK